MFQLDFAVQFETFSVTLLCKNVQFSDQTNFTGPHREKIATGC